MRLTFPRLARAAVLPLLLAAGGAQAGLFDDDEARKAILDLRARVSEGEEQVKAANARHAEATAANAKAVEQLTAQIDALRRSLLDLNNQLELLRGEIAKARGADEQIARDLAELQRRQKDIAQGFDDRLRKLEPVKVTHEGREFSVEPDERKAYDEAVATMRAGDFDKASNLFAAFMRRWPASGYTDSARYWLGNAQYAKRDYKEAIATFRAFTAASPQHPRAAEALLAVANSQAEMKDPKAARKTIEELLKSYPGTEAAQAGKERLASIK